MIIGLDGNEANVKKRVGSGIYAFELIKQFSKNKEHNFLIYLKENPLEDLPKAENFRYTAFGPKKMWTQFALPLKLTFGQKPDVFFSLGHYGPRFSKVKYCITIFDLSYLHFPDLFREDDLYQLQRWSSYSIKNAFHIFTISKSTQDDITQNYGTTPSKISVTHIGYDQDKYKPQSKEKINKIKRKYKVDGDYIIFVGTLQPRKNIERLIEAFNKIIRNSKFEIRNLKLVIVGKKGWLYEPIFEKVKKLNIEEKVIFTDYVPDVDLPALLAGSKTYVLPSLWEGFGIPVVEAQACGVPVIVSNTSSLPEIVGDSAIMINPNSVYSIAKGIDRVLTDRNLRKKLIKKGFENIKRFSWQKCANQTIKILEKVALDTAL